MDYEGVAGDHEGLAGKIGASWNGGWLGESSADVTALRE